MAGPSRVPLSLSLNQCHLPPNSTSSSAPKSPLLPVAPWSSSSVDILATSTDAPLLPDRDFPPISASCQISSKWRVSSALSKPVLVAESDSPSLPTFRSSHFESLIGVDSVHSNLPPSINPRGDLAVASSVTGSHALFAHQNLHALSPAVRTSKANLTSSEPSKEDLCIGVSPFSQDGIISLQSLFAPLPVEGISRLNHPATAATPRPPPPPAPPVMADFSSEESLFCTLKPLCPATPSLAAESDSPPFPPLRSSHFKALVDLESFNFVIFPSVNPYGVCGIDCLVTMSPGQCTHPNPHACSSEIGAPVSEMTSHEVMQKELDIGIPQNSQAGSNPPTSATQSAYLGPSAVSGSNLASKPMAIPLHTRKEAQIHHVMQDTLDDATAGKLASMLPLGSINSNPGASWHLGQGTPWAVSIIQDQWEKAVQIIPSRLPVEGIESRAPQQVSEAIKTRSPWRGFHVSIPALKQCPLRFHIVKEWNIHSKVHSLKSNEGILGRDNQSRINAGFHNSSHWQLHPQGRRGVPEVNCIFKPSGGLRLIVESFAHP
ncbi:hypothetical protein Nepgr_030917 [Nepenthes gracilis]|uniref:Uncharacterized protein n=1 Tax=Nepenthes gracilis TaxID=150966 RepID=A0AAD3THB0_NEPGR|nr:hypothetical protein Nepgr_030917 [Nepenthes gracilis]